MNAKQIKAAIATAKADDADITPQQLVDLLNELDNENLYSLTEDDDCNPIIVTDDTIYADDGNCEVEYTNHTHKEAAESYVSDGDWGNSDSTCWISVWTYKRGFDLDGEQLVFDEHRHKITLDPKEPDCLDGKEHDWRSPYSVFGGLKENPGVFGHGGGVITKACCAHCGKQKFSDSWAQDPSDGQQGLDSVTYADADDDTLAYVERRLIKAISDKFDELDAVESYKSGNGKITAVIAADVDFEQACDDIENQLDDERFNYWRDEDERELEITIS